MEVKMEPPFPTPSKYPWSEWHRCGRVTSWEEKNGNLCNHYRALVRDDGRILSKIDLKEIDRCYAKDNAKIERKINKYETNFLYKLFGLERNFLEGIAGSYKY